MLQAKEYAAAMAFPDTFRWRGSKRGRVRMAGNAMPCSMARDLVVGGAESRHRSSPSSSETTTTNAGSAHGPPHARDPQRLVHEHLDQRWDRTPGGTRRTLAGAFAIITPALVLPGTTYSEPRALRRALYSWAFNKNAGPEEPKEEWRKALERMKRNSPPVSALAEADVLRRALDALCRKLDGKKAAAETARRKRGCPAGRGRSPPARAVPSTRDRLGHAQPVRWRGHRRQGLDG
ncbi:hypothetical protein [Streptomyces nymphaeiformis]|uniref:Uncharacterized protein n=1 Tax=Streptomyces nymphaeiformis TaxID=2663842 RepID=A0A7W7U942_9ACTN|nr:hypothetical protein [Streptomyces nymphaeiformis]MBB4987133.1 hypothetical protein [Streptomyces nymphaeiformis]